jgi:hypothetical protein
LFATLYNADNLHNGEIRNVLEIAAFIYIYIYREGERERETNVI